MKIEKVDIFDRQRTNHISNVRIEGDGTPINTKVFVGDTQLNLVTKLELKLDAEDPWSVLKLEILNPELVLNIDPKDVQVVTQFNNALHGKLETIPAPISKVDSD